MAASEITIPISVSIDIETFGDLMGNVTTIVGEIATLVPEWHKMEMDRLLERYKQSVLSVANCLTVRVGKDD